MSVLEVPMPVVRPGTVLVHTYYPLISAGTEGSTERAARRSLIGKVRERPQRARQKGSMPAYRTTIKNLETYSPLSCSMVAQVWQEAVQGTDLEVR